MCICGGDLRGDKMRSFWIDMVLITMENNHVVKSLRPSGYPEGTISDVSLSQAAIASTARLDL